MINTERLHIRPFTIDDASFILALLNSPGWLKYIGDRKVYTLTAAEEYLREKLIPDYAKFNYGFFCCERLKDGVAVGMCGLTLRPYLDEPDIGFGFLEAHCGQGYALEAAQAVMQYAAEKLNIEKILAFTLPTNIRSIRLLKKIGLKEAGPFFVPGEEEELLLMNNF